MNKLLDNVRKNLIKISSSLKSRFYDDCIEHIKLESVIEEFYKSHEINDKHIVEPFRLYFYRHFEEYNFYVLDINDKDVILKLLKNSNIIIHRPKVKTEKVRINLLRQLDVWNMTILIDLRSTYLTNSIVL